MVSTDGSRDDEAREEGSPDESVLPPGPRRSTYTPPVSPASGPAEPEQAAEDVASGPNETPAPEPVLPPPPPRDDLPAFVPPPPPAPDFDFLKPETGPVNVVYQLDDIEPNLPFDIAVETLAQSPAGARILPKEPVTAPETPEPAVVPPTASFAMPSADSRAEPQDGVGVDEVLVESEPDVAEVYGDEELYVDPPASTELPEFPAWATSVAADPAPSTQPEDASDFEDASEPDEDPQLEAAPVADAEPVADEEPVADAEPVTDAEPVAESEPVSEAVPVWEADPVFEAEPVSEAGPEPEGAPTPTVDPAPVSTAAAPSDWPFDQPRAEFVPTTPTADWVEEAPLVADATATETDGAEPTFDPQEDADSDGQPDDGPVFVDPRFSGEASPTGDVAAEAVDTWPGAVEPEAAWVERDAADFEADVIEPEVFEADVVEREVFEADMVEPEVFTVEADHAAPNLSDSEPELGEPTSPPEFIEPAAAAPTVSDDAPAGAGPASMEAAEPVALTEAEQLAALSQQGAPAGRPWIPERRSLKDEELTSLLTGAIDLPNGTLGVMEELERQLQLREEETREFTEWQESMLAVGTPEAIAAVEKVLPDFTDIVPPGTSLAIAAAASTPPPPTAAPDQALGADAGLLPPPSGAPSAAVPPPPGVSASFTPAPPVAPEQTGDLGPSFEEALTASQRDAVDTAPPPLVEPPAPTTPETWSFDLDADTIVPEPVDENVADLDGVDDAELVDAPPEQFAPEPAPSKYAPTAVPEAPIFIDPVPVSTAEDVDVLTDTTAANAPALVEPGAFTGAFVDPVYTGPLTGSISITTGSLAIPPEDLDTDIDDPLDEIDQAGFDAVFGSNPATAPVLVTRVPNDEIVLGEPELHRPRIFSLEAAGAEPTPEDQRVGRAARMFWLWFAANASIVSMAFGGILFSLGLSLRQSIVAVLAGVAVSFLPLGLGTLAGKRSGQPTMVVSRAAFGLTGNALPAAIAVVSRVFWGAALLWILGQGVASILDGAGFTGGVSQSVIAYLVMAAALVVAIAFAIFGYGLIVLLQLVSSIVSAILIVGIMVLTWQHVDIGVALTHPDGPWMLAGTAAVLVFSFIGLLWANSSGDLARYQRPGSSTPGSMLSTGFGATIPTFVLISYGALLAASSPEIAAGLVADPFVTIGELLPAWYPAPLIAALALGLLSAVVVSIYSGGFALTAVGVRLSRLLTVVVISVLIAVGAVTLMLVGTDYTMLFRDLATTLAVPVAAWAGIFAADAMIRQRTYDTEALLVRGGVYPPFNWVNLSALVVIIAIGLGLTTASVAGLTWQGYLFPLLGLPVDGAVAGTDLGVIVALVLGLLVPIVAGIPTIRKQEATARRSG